MFPIRTQFRDKILLMKTSIILTILMLSLSSFGATVNLRFTQTADKSGKIFVAVFDDARAFPKDHTNVFLKKLVPVTSSQTETSTTIDLPPGNYAIAIFLDENGNEKLDTNMLGIPKERFGFSNNRRIITGPPSFGEAEIEVKDGQNNFIINLIKLF